MANWLQKILPRSPGTPSSRNLPVKAEPSRLPAHPVARPSPEGLPNASAIYGVAASILFVVALYFLFTARWVTALLLFLLSGCFLGFALHFMKYRS